MSTETTAPGTWKTAADTPRTLREALGVFSGHWSPRILVTALTAAIAARFYVGGFSAWDMLPPVVVLAYWPILEWLIHVYLLHFKPVTLRGRTIDFDVARKHRMHHRNPWNYDVLFIPLRAYPWSLLLVVALWFGIMPTTGMSLTGICAHLVLSLHYEAVHFLVHTRVNPRFRYYRRLWQNHRRHHFKNEHFWYGVTMLGGDHLLRTAPASQTVESSTTCQDLEAGWAE